MLGPLLALAVLASGDTCAQVWSGIESGKDFKDDVLGDVLHNDASKVAVLRSHFLERCAKLPDADQACGVSHAGRTMTRACPALGTAFHESATQPDVAGAAVNKLREEGLAREAVAKLRVLGQAARELRKQNGPKDDFQFPPSVGETPAKPCCEYPAKACPHHEKDWANPTWQGLGFAPKEPLRFHYSFTSVGQGRAASFVLRAVGDPECTGQVETWELTGKSDGHAFTVSDVEKK